MSERYFSPEKASEMLNVSRRTLQIWESKGEIKCIRTPGNHRRFPESEILSKQRERGIKSKRKICYCRVSTASQKEDLERQIEYFRSQYPNHEIIKDIGSGLNFKRKGFNSILDSGKRGDIEEIVVTHKDRLCRFGFELVERIIGEGKILVLNNEQTSPQEELVKDLISIITVFSSRLYGLRSHTLKKQIKACRENKDFKDKDISEEGRKGEAKLNV